MATSLYRKWIVANGWSEGVGLGATFLLGFAVAPRLAGEPGAATVLPGALLAVILGTLLEGTLVGYAQGRVLHGAVPELSIRSWTWATMAGAAAAWTLGMIPSTFFGLTASDAAGSATPVEPSALAQYGLAIIMGLVLGVVLGFPQSRVLRRVTPAARIWLPANAAAWAGGMLLIFVGMDFLPWGGAPLIIALGALGICFAAGTAVGAIHGLFLIRLLRPWTPPAATGPMPPPASELLPG